MRLDGKSCLYYPVFSRQYNEETGEREYSEEEARHTLVTCLGEMVPVRPRRQISYPLHMLHGKTHFTFFRNLNYVKMQQKHSVLQSLKNVFTFLVLYC